MDQFPFMKECLKEFNYPQIHGMDEVEIADVFSKANRQFLISWILKQVDEGYCDVVEKATKEELANLIYCNGFCSASDKNKFVNGECESSKQFAILYKMFKYLKSLSESKKFDGDSKIVSIKEIEDRLKFDTNLFPMYGAKQTLTPKERSKKIADYRKEIEDLRSTLNIEHEDQGEHVVDPTLRGELVSAMRSLDINFPDFTRKNLDIMKNRDTVDTDKNLFSEDFGETLDACNANIKTALEFITSMNVVTNFKENNSRVENIQSNNKNNAMMRELAELCNEVAALKKEHMF